jgi:hypothetical protein
MATNGCDKHPQSITWWRTLPGYRGEHAACGICGHLYDARIREQVEAQARQRQTEERG